MRIHRRRHIWLSILAIAVAAAIIANRGLSHRRRSQDADLENLRSVPYASWTSKRADLSLVGVVKYDRSRASPGYNLFTDDHDRAFLMDMRGYVVHQWKFENAKHCEFVRIYPNGDAVGVCEGFGLRKVDKNSKSIWFHPGPVNHDVEIRPDGSLIVSEIKQTVNYNGRRVLFGGLTFLDRDGRNAGSWSVWDGKAPAVVALHPPGPLDRPARGPLKKDIYEYDHLNSVQSIPDTPIARNHPEFAAGNLLVSLRNLNLIFIMDWWTRKIVWSWGPRVLDNQHAPTMLKNGHMLVFDNGLNRHFSRVLELDPVEKKIVWRYPPRDDRKFFSAFRGNAQRLNNGNTLICEAEKGHAFEVAPNGDVVWDFWSPFFNASSQRLRIYRMNRVTIDPESFSSGEPILINALPSPADGITVR